MSEVQDPSENQRNDGKGLNQGLSPASALGNTPLDYKQPESRPPLTYGEKAVGLTFNLGGTPDVNFIKQKCAVVIDELNNQMQEAIKENNGEKIAQYKLAIRDIQTGQMWGVKAATWQY